MTKKLSFHFFVEKIGESFFVAQFFGCTDLFDPCGALFDHITLVMLLLGLEVWDVCQL